jgi:hypothetical protein
MTWESMNESQFWAFFIHESPNRRSKSGRLTDGVDPANACGSAFNSLRDQLCVRKTSNIRSSLLIYFLVYSREAIKSNRERPSYLDFILESFQWVTIAPLNLLLNLEAAPAALFRVKYVVT